MADYGIRFAKGFSLEDALAILEDDEDLALQVDDITIMPPSNSCGTITDEDSGDEDCMSINNLLGSQLQANAEITLLEDSDEDVCSDPEDNIPLSKLVTKAKAEGKIKAKKIVFDNFFTSVPLIEKLTEKNFAATGTIRENRLPGAQLRDSKVMKKQKRGTYDSQRISDQNIIAMKWNDNNIVTLCSNTVGVQPIHQVKRYSQKEKKTVQIDQPNIVGVYNTNMGGVDRSDQNISLYRVGIRGKKWYFSLICHCIDMAVQNAWQLHRIHGGGMDQLAFRRRIAITLLQQNKKTPSYSKGRPSGRVNVEIRFDRLDHLVVSQETNTMWVVP